VVREPRESANKQHVWMDAPIVHFDARR